MILFEILSAFLEREYNKNQFDAGVWIVIIIAFLDWTFFVLNNKIINWPVTENSRERCDVINIIPHCKHWLTEHAVYFIAL